VVLLALASEVSRPRIAAFRRNPTRLAETAYRGRFVSSPASQRTAPLHSSHSAHGANGLWSEKAHLPRRQCPSRDEQNKNVRLAMSKTRTAPTPATLCSTSRHTGLPNHARTVPPGPMSRVPEAIPGCTGSHATVSGPRTSLAA